MNKELIITKSKQVHLNRCNDNMDIITIGTLKCLGRGGSFMDHLFLVCHIRDRHYYILRSSRG